jgi:hypothetical protein
LGEDQLAALGLRRVRIPRNVDQDTAGTSAASGNRVIPDERLDEQQQLPTLRTVARETIQI